ncbi:MAG: UDP-N-acetylglucosamine 2-epimerase [Gammaproteobacteria bacterium]|jgi:UDP-N-acetylglucosamine 2-epimerase (non-hydrolysing)|nr:UDP-N-acetylglucosamine 2-epimerase [Gammaproteobacteria bacterium]
MDKKKIKIACVIGTRPEVIKMAPIIYELRKYPQYELTLLCTAQHRGLMDEMLSIFSLVPDIDLNIMKENQSLSALTSELFLKIEPVIKDKHYSLVIAQGDTTTTLVTAEVCFFNNIPFAHVEAGLRSYDFHRPFPEELNRVFTSKIATLHFAPSEEERTHLILEGIRNKRIFVTGNTVIDSLYFLSTHEHPLPFLLPENKRVILVTMHRRESFGKPIKDIFTALIRLTELFDDIVITYPVHPNPHVNKLAYELLSGNPSIQLLDPLPYDAFVTLMKKSYFIITDSGGLQEEAPALSKPILVLREKTERPLIIKLGLGRLVGTQTESIISNATDLLTDETQYQAMAKQISPYGDGHAAEKIVHVINHYLSHDNQPVTLRNKSDKKT